MKIFNRHNLLEKLLKGLKYIAPLGLVLLLSACGDEEPCPTVQDYLNEGISTQCTGCKSPEDGNCFLCRLFSIITEASAEAAKTSWNLFAADLIPVVTLAAAIYIAIYVLKNVGYGDNVQGFAFGYGMSKFPQIEYKLPELRILHDKNIKVFKKLH